MYKLSIDIDDTLYEIILENQENLDLSVSSIIEASIAGFVCQNVDTQKTWLNAYLLNTVPRLDITKLEKVKGTVY